MINKIIINGIDVSKCKFCVYEHCQINYDEWNNETIKYNECKNSPDCYYKQLKRKEQECESQRFMIDYYIKKTAQLLDDIDEYKQAFDEIKKTC